MKLCLLPLAAVLACLLAFPGFSAAADPAPQPAIEPGEPFVPGELIVQYKGAAEPETVEVGEDVNVKALAEKLEAKPAVVHATPNYVARISAWLPNDPGVNPTNRGQRGGWQLKQWNFLPCLSLCGSGASSGHQSLGGINAVRAWRELRQAGRPGARGVRVAVLDTGIAYRNYGRHYQRDPDLSARTFLPGHDFVDDDRIPLDRNGHGTHVSSTISQSTNNNRGLTGIAYGAKLIPVRVMDANGYGSTENITAGIRWATDHGAQVISMSINFACGIEVPSLEDALTYAHTKGVVLVGSDGNKGAQACPSLPATAPQVISVGGSTESGCIGNYSFHSTSVDIAAPGGGATTNGCPYRNGNRPVLQVGMVGHNPTWFGIEPGWKGTSMAAAHVSAGAAMIIASDVLKDGKGPRQVKERLLGTARLPDYAKDDPTSGFGAGIMNLGRAVNPDVP
ncbi:MAG: S8 family serine peptidase [Thermoleophilia bacterium]|nr:S8 family serine peptidase [Thermoleophilia bacterium]